MMTTPTYCTDKLGTWHGVRHVNEFAHEVRGLCGYDFKPVTPPVTRRPHPNQYCAGCLGSEQREAEQRKKATA